MPLLLTSSNQCPRTPQAGCTLHQKKPINRVILFLIGIELLLASTFALAGPFIAVFITQGIKGGTLTIVGITTTIFLITKSILQIFFSRAIDRISDEKSVAAIMSVGYAIVGLSPFILAFSTGVWSVFISSLVCGVGGALLYPTWNQLFTLHIDKEQAAFEWSMYDTAVGISGALAATLGGVLIDKVGFQYVFMAVGLLMMASSFLPGFLYGRVRDVHT
ncbi:MAG: MFS transporter [Candidatus Methylomirabilales bacterium]